MAIGKDRPGKTECRNGRNKGATAQFECRHVILPFDNRPLGGSVAGKISIQT
jgi:hypothetical protein